MPVLRNAELLSFAEIEQTIGDFAARAKSGQLKPDELMGGTFTITNGGVFGSMLSTPIVNPPQSGILGLHAIQDRPVARNGQVVIRPMMYVALTYDHRIVDGREAVGFLEADQGVHRGAVADAAGSLTPDENHEARPCRSGRRARRLRGGDPSGATRPRTCLRRRSSAAGRHLPAGRLHPQQGPARVDRQADGRPQRVRGARHPCRGPSSIRR